MADRKHEPDVRFRFDHDVRAIRQARKRLDPLLSEPDDVIAADVRLATSEMVTNVIAHTDGGGEMRAWDPQPDVPFRVEVEDHDQAPLSRYKRRRCQTCLKATNNRTGWRACRRQRTP